ncbi:hypothetical protein GOBAR_AA00683 [Gossypium barbadense]|uniref:Uncharacterized protein n=1 Tax=Gossypium barbadense TaxID=3634 RepID=A0A2P5YWG0_GOSBA|nr:hypothetical protein GOBAR_AA00683 [Gossypium barbadense]
MVNHDEQPGTITSSLRASDVKYLFQVAEDGWIGDSNLYSHLGGLTKMFNSGGAIKGLKYETENPVATVIMKVQGCDPFGA